MKKDLRLLLVRLDRIGDLVLSLPVDESFNREFVRWWIPKGLGFVTENAQPPRKAFELSRKISFGEFFKLLSVTRKAQFDAAIIFHAPWWAGLLITLAGIPLRIGVQSQWHSFLFFNRGIRQKRSQADRSELEYNFQLAEMGLGQRLQRTTLKLTQIVPGETPKVLTEYNLEEGRYAVVHPGMGGSALNWPTAHYETLIRRLLKSSKVVITGTQADEAYLAPLRESLAGTVNLVWLDKILQGPELLQVLASARTVTAPSTGVVHLAASTGVPTLGLFSPVRVQRPERWGPQGPFTKTVMPQVDCPGQMNCIGKTCPHYFCMDKISPDEVFNDLSALAQQKQSSMPDPAL